MDLLSVKEAAQLLGVTEQHIRLLIRTGQMAGQKIGKQWVLPPDVLETYRGASDLVHDVADHPKRDKDMPSIKALSFFSGAMGLDIGLEKAGIHVLLASEIDKKCRETIVTNRPNIALIGDIRDYTADDIRQVAGLKKKDNIDLIIGGPPCQAFSTAGNRRGFEDERGNVFLTFINLILALKPTYAVIENVRGLLSAPLTHRPHDRRGFGFPPLTPEEEKGGAFQHILNMLKSGGYGISFNLYNSANFGSPQIRERVITICSKNGTRAPFLTPTHSETGLFGLPKWKSFQDAVKGLKKDSHHFVRFPEKRLFYYRLLKEGQNWKSLPEEMQKEALGASYYAGGGKTGFFRRLAWNAPSPTLVTHPAMPATDLAHPVEDRPLSVEEYKRIQEFPDSYVICGSLVDQYRQIGNAVPCSLGAAVGRLITSLLKGKAIKQYPNFPYSRYRNTSDIEWQDMMVKRQFSTEDLQDCLF